MPTRTAEAEWRGDLKTGKGEMKVGSGAFDVPFSFKTRFEEGPGTNPEELIGAAHAGCFSMALSNELAQAGHVPNRVHTTAKVHFGMTDNGPAITKIELDCRADVPGITDDEFQKLAVGAKKNCPVSKALAATDITLNATLESGG
jgi:osmotically inducible protein OsmC